jgi:hypothetical protein
MRARRVVRPKQVVAGIAVSAVFVVIGSVRQAQAQALPPTIDLNLQSTLSTFTIPLADQLKQGLETGACQYNPADVWKIYDANTKAGKDRSRERRFFDERSYSRYFKDIKDDEKKKKELSDLAAEERQNYLNRYYDVDQKEAKEKGSNDPRVRGMSNATSLSARQREKLRAFVAVNIPDFCKVPQWTKVKISFPFNPTYETNVLRSNQGDSPGTSLGFGGTFLVTASPGLRDRPYDLIAFSAQATSVRYPAFPAKNVDAVTTQGAYQFLLDANGYIPGRSNPIHIESDLRDVEAVRLAKTDVEAAQAKVNELTKPMPAANMITADTFALGYQNQTAFTPTFHHETADLFTPQGTLARSNMPLFGSDGFNQCAPAGQDKAQQPDKTKSGFCYYADFSLTVGQTFSDQITQENANVAASATLGKRFDKTDFKLALQTTVTEKTYEYFPGGRQDLQLQIGPTLSYAPSASNLSTDGNSITSAVAFSLTATYNQNYSTVAAAAWRGVIVQPTLTIAFQPPASLPADHH